MSSSLVVGGKPLYIPEYDRWSNEGGGRDLEMARRRGSEMETARLEAELARTTELSNAAVLRAQGRYETARAAFIEKYGADALNGKELALQSRGDGDTIDLSDAAKTLLADFDALEKQRIMTERGQQMSAFWLNVHQQHVETQKAMADWARTAYDHRFEKDPIKRGLAYAEFMGMRDRFAAINARPKPETTDFSVAPIVPAGELFVVDAKGRIGIDTKGTALLGPADQAKAEMARLVEALGERNGLSQVRDALLRALDGQNRQIAQLAAGLKSQAAPTGA